VEAEAEAEMTEMQVMGDYMEAAVAGEVTKALSV
jgi:hypothetical protein